MQVLSKDLRTVRELVETTVQRLGAGAPGGPGSALADACAALEPMAESHAQQLLPRVRECDRWEGGLIPATVLLVAPVSCNVDTDHRALWPIEQSRHGMPVW